MMAATLGKLKEAMSLQLKGQFADAEVIYQQVLASEPDNADANHLLGLIRSEQDANDEAIALIEKAIGLNGRAAPFHHNIAGIYRRMGRLSDAEREFRSAIDLKADYGEAYQGLGEMVKFVSGDPIEGKINAQLARTDLPAATRCYFSFSAGKFYDDIANYDLAYEHYTRGNREANRRFESLQFRQQIKDTIYVYGNACIAVNREAGIANSQPTFVVGMPRSGTTLVEQILASHSKVYGAGELNDMKYIAAAAQEVSRVRQAFPNCISGMSVEGYSVLAKQYLERVARVVDINRYERVVDKHPLNFQFVGLIFHLFPNARIIHTVRNPFDTCLSCFFQNFTKGQHYSFDMLKLGHFYNDYNRLMEHWDVMFPGKIQTIRYESLLEDPERETRRMLDFCGLPFEDACLNFHETERVVKTASFLQVRQPIYKTSKNRWRNYASHLGELARILGVSIDPGDSLSNGSAT